MGDAGWQTVLAEVLDRWTATSAGRIPAGWEEPRRQRPDRRVLTDAGFAFRGAFRFAEDHRWTVADLIGFVYATSFLPRHALGARAADFEADMHASLDRCDRGAGLHQTITFAYELYRRSRTPS